MAIRRILSVLVVITALLFGTRARLWADGADDAYFTPTYRLVFYAVLEGCFEEGLSDADVSQMLLKEKPDTRFYEHFIYACPICVPTIHALETYRQRPDPYGTKVPGNRTFGAGLPAELHDRLYSEDVKRRLSAIHDLEEAWINRRVASLRLTPEELARINKGLRKGREQGMRVLQSFIERKAMDMAPAYEHGGECAVCNAAAGMKLKLAEDKPTTPKPEAQ